MILSGFIDSKESTFVKVFVVFICLVFKDQRHARLLT